MKEAFENNMLVFRKCKELNSRYLLFQKIFLLITGGSSLIGGIAAFVYTGNIISLPLLLILWGLLLLFYANFSQIFLASSISISDTSLQVPTPKFTNPTVKLLKG